MFYKKVNTIVSLSLAGGTILFLLGFFIFLFTPWLGIFCGLLALLFTLVAMNPDLLNLVRRIAISRFGSHEENDILAHFADVFFAKIITSNISAQLDVKNESDMVAFADALKNMFGEDVLLDIKKFYSEVSEPQWENFFNSLIRVGKDAMHYVFFPETNGNLNPTQAAQKLKEQYPFMTEDTLRKLIEWWGRFKAKMEWQNQADSAQR